MTRWYIVAVRIRLVIGMVVSMVGIVACVGAEDGDVFTGAADQPDIVLDSAQPSTVAQNYTVRIEGVDGDSVSWICTGTLIASDVVMTARHCIQRADTTSHDSSQWHWLDEYDAPSSIRVGVGALVDELEYYSVLSTAVDRDNLVGGGVRGNDIALLHLAHGVENVDVATVSAYPVQARATYVAVGWGIQYQGGPAVSERQQAMYAVTNRGIHTYQSADMPQPYNRAEMVGGRAACSGDSGGPLILQVGGLTRVVGIASMADCRTVTYYQSPSAHLPMICGALRSAGHDVPSNLLCDTYVGGATTGPARCCSGAETLSGF